MQAKQGDTKDRQGTEGPTGKCNQESLLWVLQEEGAGLASLNNLGRLWVGVRGSPSVQSLALARIPDCKNLTKNVDGCVDWDWTDCLAKMCFQAG